jgi:hypothetical protein
MLNVGSDNTKVGDGDGDGSCVSYSIGSSRLNAMLNIFTIQMNCMYGALKAFTFSNQKIVPNFSSIQFGFCCFYWGCARECPFMYLTQ